MFRSSTMNFIKTRVDPVTGKLKEPLPESYYRLGAGPNRNNVLRNLSTRDFFSLSQQRYIPIHAIVYANTILKKSDDKIVDIVYTKPRVHVGSRYVSKLSQNIISKFTHLEFASPLGSVISEVFRTDIRFLNEAFNLYIGPGILFDGDGKILASVVLDKSFLGLIARGEGDQNLNIFYNHLTSGTGTQKMLLKKFGSLIISKDFLESRKYRNLYNNFISTFVKGENSFQLNLIITDNVEESTFNPDSEDTISYSSIREKIEEQKSVWGEVLKEY